MNKLLNLLFIDLKLLSKTKVFYLKLILFPCALILLLGSILGNSTSEFTTFDVAFYSEDSAVSQASESLSLGEILKNDVLTSSDAKEVFNLKEVNNYSEGEELVKDKKVAVFLYIPTDFTKNYIDNTKNNIVLIGDKSKPIDKSIIKNLLDRFTQNIETIKVEETFIKDSLTMNTKVSTSELQNIIESIQKTSDYKDELTKASTNNNTQPIDIMKYETIAMVVMFSILTSFELAHNIVDDKLKNTQFRIKSTPTLDIQYVLGKISGMILAITVQMLVVMLISHLAFGVSLGNVFSILITTISYGFAIGSIVFCVGAKAKDQMSISSFTPIILYGFSFLGGSFMSVDSLPSSLQKLQQILPNGIAINSYLKICQGSGLSDIYVNLLELIFIGLVFIMMSLFLYRERRFTKNANVNNDKKSIKATL